MLCNSVERNCLQIFKYLKLKAWWLFKIWLCEGKSSLLLKVNKKILDRHTGNFACIRGTKLISRLHVSVLLNTGKGKVFKCLYYFFHLIEKTHSVYYICYELQKKKIFKKYVVIFFLEIETKKTPKLLYCSLNLLVINNNVLISEFIFKNSLFHISYKDVNLFSCGSDKNDSY